MAKRNLKRDPRSGAPGISQKRSAGAPSLNELTIKQRYLDPTIAARGYEHPCVQWSSKEVQDVKPRSLP